MFSPYYAWSRRFGAGDPLDHCAVNVVLHGPRARRWAFTERGRADVARDARTLRIGPSALSWDGEALTIELDEMAAYVPRRVRGTIRVRPAALTGHTVPLDAAGRHRWSPLAPVSRVEVALNRPGLRWEGPGYLDSNDGDAALERDFDNWHWSRAPTRDGAVILYDAVRRDGSERAVAIAVDRAGTVRPIEPPPWAALRRSRWGIDRRTRADPGHAAQVRATLLDAPFYARSVIASHLGGEPVTAMHESLWLDRFAAPWVQAMLPFRVPRAFLLNSGPFTPAAASRGGSPG